MIRSLVNIGILATLITSCGGSSDSGSQGAAGAGVDLSKGHFFSVAWGCVEFSLQDLAAQNYQIQDFTVEDGACPSSIPVLDQLSQPLFTCDVPIGPPQIPATYIFYDKRSTNGQGVEDLSRMFTADNFCPVLLQTRDYK